MNRIIGGTFLLFISLSAFATELRYNYINLGYDWFEAGVVNSDGVSVDGSWQFYDMFRALASYKRGDGDLVGSDFDTTDWTVGLGYHHSLTTGADVVAQISYLDTEISTGASTVSDSGFGFDLGLRLLFTDKVEGNLSVSHENLEGFFDPVTDDTTLTAGGLYHFADHFAVGMHGRFDADNQNYAAFGRYSF